MNANEATETQARIRAIRRELAFLRGDGRGRRRFRIHGLERELERLKNRMAEYEGYERRDA